MKILVVDDNSDICQMIETILLSEGYEAVSCINPLIAGAMVKKHKPKLLITDILMSGLDGRNLVKEIRSSREGNKVKILMMSANPAFENICETSGADAFLAKPFQIDDFLETVNSLLI